MTLYKLPAPIASHVAPPQGWQVALRELKQALDTEIHFYQQQLDLGGWPNAVNSDLSLPAMLPGSHGNFSSQQLASLTPAQRCQLLRAEIALALAERNRDWVAAAIQQHNQRMERQSPLSWLWHFADNLRRAEALVHRRARALWRVRRQRSYLQSLVVSFRRQISNGDNAWLCQRQQQDMIAQRQRAILHNYRSTELSLRQRFRRDIAGLDDDSTVQIFHRNLDEALDDPALKNQLLKINKKSNL